MSVASRHVRLHDNILLSSVILTEHLKLLLVFYQWRFSVWLFEDNKKWGKGRYMLKKKKHPQVTHKAGAV